MGTSGRWELLLAGLEENNPKLKELSLTLCSSFALLKKNSKHPDVYPRFGVLLSKL